MIVQKVSVTEVTDNELVLGARSSACNHCETSCGAMSLAALFGGRQQRSIRIANPGGFKPGDQAELLIERAFFIKTVFYQYIFPLLAALLSVIPGAFLSAAFALQLVFLILGLASGIYLSRVLIRRLQYTMSDNTLQLRKTESTTEEGNLKVQLVSSL